MEPRQSVVLSVVTTLYRSEAFIEEFVSRITASAQEIRAPYEIILVNDGCPADSFRVALQMLDKFPHLKLVDLSRNFGHHPAMMAGLSQARGAYVYLTNVDLEERPENLTEIWRVFMDREKDGVDVVYGVEADRKGSFIKRIAGGIFYPIFNFLSDIKLPTGQIVSRLMSRRYVDALLEFRERDIFIPALWELAGFRQEPTLVGRDTPAGPTTYSFVRRLELAVRAITSFSSKPLELIFYSGLLISLASALVILLLIAQKIVMGGALSGWTSLIVSLFLMNGLVIFSIGIIGIYLSRMFLEIKGRPSHIIRSVSSSADVRAFDRSPAKDVS